MLDGQRGDQIQLTMRSSSKLGGKKSKKNFGESYIDMLIILIEILGSTLSPINYRIPI